MSWSLYATARSPTDAKQYITELKAQSPETPHAPPAVARDLVLAALELSAIPEGYGVKVEASGYAPGGTTRVLVEPITFVR